MKGGGGGTLSTDSTDVHTTTDVTSVGIGPATEGVEYARGDPLGQAVAVTVDPDVACAALYNGPLQRTDDLAGHEEERDEFEPGTK